MANNIDNIVLDFEDLDEELIEITPSMTYEQSDSQDLPETAASSSSTNFCCSAILL